MNDKNLIKKIQSDFIKSNPKIINNDDNISTIQKKFSSKYTEDISDSEDDELTSYKNRNIKMINNLPNFNNINKTVKKKKSLISDNFEDIEDNIINNNDNINDNNDNNNNENNNNNVNNNNVNNELEIDEDSEHQYEYSEEFKKKVKEYVKNDDRIRELQTELKLLNGAKKNSEIEILKHLERLGESNVNITGGKLRINQYESKEGLKEELIKEALSEKIKDPTIIEFIFEKINEKRIANGKVQKSIKRTFERENKKKGKK
jgi:hypothetical protein